MLDEILDTESGMSGWEMDFIENLDKNFRDFPLTGKQIDVLINIHEKVVK